MEGAIEVYRWQAEYDSWHAPALTARLLARHGRGAEAVEVVRAMNSAEDRIVDLLCELLAAEGRAGEGLAHLDALEARGTWEPWELFRLRARLLAACGRLDEAVEEARASSGSGARTPRRRWLGSSPMPGVRRRPSPSWTRTVRSTGGPSACC
ncbi:hypothetical protein [Streptomyces cinereoruber]|uniref:hypothetical protein n=1 Tax=Streptomyces cinereoruber TaxID=67260 RepID=UPI00345DDECD